MEEETRVKILQTSSSTSTLRDPAGAAQLKPDSNKDNSTPLLPKVSSQGNNSSQEGHVDRTGGLGGPWLLEWCALICCIASFGGLVALLAQYNNKRLSEWKWAISINTVISILGVISKASLAFSVSACIAQFKWNWFSKQDEPLIDFDRFDAASRGLWGSFRLIRTTTRRPHWIALGAIATIILPGFSPFLQALVVFQNENFVQVQNGTWLPEVTAKQGKSYINNAYSSRATLGKSTNLRVGSYTQSPVGTAALQFTGPNGETLYFNQLNYELAEMDFGMTAAIWNGLSDLIRPSDLWPKYTCASGNCTWDSYSSIAVCSRCNEISQHLEKTTGRVILPDNYTTSAYDTTHVPEISYPGLNVDNSTWTAWTVPVSGANISNYDGPFSCGPSCKSQYKTEMTVKVVNNPGETMTFQDLRTMLVAVQILKSADSWTKNETLWEKSKPTVHECSLSFCAAVYESNVTAGLLYETSNSWNNRSPNSFESFQRNNDAYTQYRNYSLDLRNVNRTDLQLYIPRDSEEAGPEFQGQTFNISQSTIFGVIQELLRGFGETPGGFDTTDERNIPLIAYPGLEVNGSLDYAIALAKSTNLSTTFGNLASSLSKWIRDRASEELPAQGRTTQNMVVIKINWYFIILPAISLGMGLVVVSLAIADTTRKRIPVWKADIFMALGYGTDGTLHDRLGEAATENGLYQTARETKIWMRNESGRGKLTIKDHQD